MFSGPEALSLILFDAVNTDEAFRKRLSGTPAVSQRKPGLVSSSLIDGSWKKSTLLFITSSPTSLDRSLQVDTHTRAAAALD